MYCTIVPSLKLKYIHNKHILICRYWSWQWKLVCCDLLLSMQVVSHTQSGVSFSSGFGGVRCPLPFPASYLHLWLVCFREDFRILGSELEFGLFYNRVPEGLNSSCTLCHIDAHARPLQWALLPGGSESVRAASQTMAPGGPCCLRIGAPAPKADIFNTLWGTLQKTSAFQTCLRYIM